MTESETRRYVEPTQEAGRVFMAQQLEGAVVMLNLLRFREVADYAASPELAPPEPVSGAQAYQLYVAHIQPLLRAAGGELVFAGTGGKNLIGPGEEHWDLVLLVRHASREAFLSFASSDEYKAGQGHRTAALEDSRLLPMLQQG